MDATLVAILLIVVLLAVRLGMIAWRLRRAKQDRDLLDPHALDEAKGGLNLHRDLREEAKQEPGRLLQEAKDLSRRPR